MATPKTSTFTLTEVVALTAAAADGSRFTGDLSLGAYVDVGDKQGIAIESITYIWQNGSNYDSNPEGMLAANGSLGIQVSDLNPGGVFVRADDVNLIGSGHMNIDWANNITSRDSDIYPDIYGKSDDTRIVVNDSLYLVAGNDGAAIGGATVYCSVLIRAKIVKLSTKDFMAIAVQSVASDN